MAQLPPGGATFTTPDPVEWAKLTPGGQDHTSSARDGTKSYRETWRVKVAAPNASLAAVRASRRLPADRMPLYAHEVAADPLLLGTYMRADPPVERDGTVGVVLRDVKATADPYYFDVVVYYEGVDDPTAVTPEAYSEEVPYEEYLTSDVNGKPVTNSALDPIDGGMPSTGFFKKVTVTRNLPYGSWHMKKGDPYRKTLNRAPFIYPEQFEVDGITPIQELPGAVLIDSIRERRLERAKLTGAPAASRYYWEVTVELLVDLMRVRGADGTRVSRLHRWVVPDAGYHEFREAAAGPPVKLRKQAVRVDSSGSHAPQLLDGKGRALLPRTKQLNELPADFSPYVATSALGGLCPDFYACPGGGAFTVTDALGVLANDTDPTVTSVTVVDDVTSGTLSLAAGGGFTYTPDAGYVGWDFFTYKPTGAMDSAKQSCQIFVGAVPVLLWFDRCRFSNWADIAVLLEGW